MKWSVAVEADGDRVMTREEIVELADAVAMSRGIASGIGTSSYGAQVVVEAADRDDAVARATEVFSAAVVAAGLPLWPVARVGVISEADDDEDYFDDDGYLDGEDGVIRLGSLAGYPFEGPRVLGGWTPPARPAVYCIAYKPDEAKEDYAVIYVGHSEDLSTERLPFRHPAAACWVKRAGSRWKVYICTYEAPGAMRSHREQIVKELCAVYAPSCNDQQYDVAWKDEWIGEYTAPTAGPLTTGRDPVA